MPTADALLEAWRIRLRETMVQRLKPWLTAGLQLGPLEDKLLRALWSRGHATVRELIEDSAVDGAYTTIETTLDRLYRKDLLARSRQGRAFRYGPKRSEAELNQKIVAEGLKKLLNSAGQHQAPLSFLVEAISQHKNHAALLEQLEQAIARKRRDLRSIRAPAVARVKPKKNVRRVVKRRTRRAA